MDVEMMNQVFTLIETFGNPIFTESQKFYNFKTKLLRGDYESIEKKEFTEYVAALKSAEQKCSKIGHKDLAFVLRRVLYHADEEGLPELARLKKKYRWSFI